MTMIMSYNSNDALDKEFENEINDTFQDSLDRVIAMLNGDIPVDTSIVSTVEYLKNSLCGCKVNEIFDTAEYFCDVYDEGLQD